MSLYCVLLFYFTDRSTVYPGTVVILINPPGTVSSILITVIIDGDTANTPLMKMIVCSLFEDITNPKRTINPCKLCQ